MLGQSWPKDMGDNAGVPESWETTKDTCSFDVSGVLMFLELSCFEVLNLWVSEVQGMPEP